MIARPSIVRILRRATSLGETKSGLRGSPGILFGALNTMLVSIPQLPDAQAEESSATAWVLSKNSVLARQLSACARSSILQNS